MGIKASHVLGHDLVRDVSEYGRVAVLLGGSAAEREVSLNSGRAVLQALLSKGLNAEGVDPQNDSLSSLEDFDRAFIALHGRGGEDGSIQGYLETIGLPFTGSGVLGSAIAMDKIRSKQIWQASNLPTPKYFICNNEINVDHLVDSINFPLIVKPASEGSSLGMTKVDHADDLMGAIDLALSFDHEVLVEEWVEGYEYTVGILQGEALPVIQIETANEFYDYDAKYNRDDTRYRCPSDLSPENENQLQQLALEAFSQVAASGWGRVDIICDMSDKPFLIEVNTIPGMTDHSLLPKAAGAAGIGFEELVLKVLETSFIDGFDQSVGAMQVNLDEFNDAGLEVDRSV